MNWYKKILYAQIWETSTDDSFEGKLKSFYELEYKYQALKNFPFKGTPQRYQNIWRNLEESLEAVMEELKGTLLTTFGGWLESHAITEPALWAEQRTDPHGEGFMSSYDAEQVLEGIIGEYLRYKNGGPGAYNINAYNRPSMETTFLLIFDEVLSKLELFPSLKGIKSLIDDEERERLWSDLSYDGFENFGINERGEPFSSEEEAEQYIEKRIDDLDIKDYLAYYDKQALLNLLEAQGTLDNFLAELNQHIVFPLWYSYWSGMGIDSTRDLAQDAYNELENAQTFEEFHRALEIAIQTCHQNGSMLDYLSEYGQDYSGLTPEQTEELMLELTEGKSNAEWDRELMEIGVQIPASVKKHNKEMAMV